MPYDMSPMNVNQFRIRTTPSTEEIIGSSSSWSALLTTVLCMCCLFLPLQVLEVAGEWILCGQFCGSGSAEALISEG